MSSQLPKEILEKAIQLRNGIRRIYITLYTRREPSTSTEIADLVSKARSYVNMRLQELVDMGLATVQKKGKTNYYEAKR